MQPSKMILAGSGLLASLVIGAALAADAPKPAKVSAIAVANKKDAVKADSAKPTAGKAAAKPSQVAASQLDLLLAEENTGKKLAVAPLIDDLAYLRRVTVDLLGRIPTADEIDAYQQAPAAERRTQLVERLLSDKRFADRWTVFFGDLFRIRSAQPGGDALTAFVHQSLENSVPYDVMSRELIVANGKAGKVPQVGFVLGDDADPMALAGVTAQVFMGIRVSCAQCHDHPFDTWTREQFYGLAAYFGKTRRYESRLTKAIYTTETDDTTVLWPPEDAAKGKPRLPMAPKFPFTIDTNSTEPKAIARLVSLRAAEEARRQVAAKPTAPTLDELLSDAAQKASASTSSEKEPDAVTSEAKRDARSLRVENDLYRESQLRKELARLVTDPKNRYFSRALVNRLWAELVGKGFVEPVDDFNAKNPPSHPQTLDYLADEFVASGYDLRTPLRMIVSSQAYQRAHVATDDLATRQDAEDAFVSAPVRRMLSEAMFDSLAQAGHLYSAKHAPGDNLKTITTIVRESVGGAGKLASIKPAGGAGKTPAMAAQPSAAQVAAATGYDLESAIEVNFDAILTADKDAPEMEAMEAMSNEQLEAEMMQEQAKYVEREVKTTIDDNPVFSSSMRMASPAPSTHFLRIFGQTSRDALGEARTQDASMRQALMMLNGRLTHEASRVGKLEPIYPLLVGDTANVAEAVRLAYREILTREPAADELADAKSVIAAGDSPLEGMADLRWALFNCHEFRFLP